MIHVSFTITDASGKYSAVLGCALESLLRNTKEKVCVHVLHDESYSEAAKQKISRLVGAHGQSVKYYTIRFSDVIANVYNRKLNNAVLVCLFRLYLPQVISKDIDKIIYLDSDIIVNCDINELWCMDLEGRSLGAVIDEGLSFDHYFVEHIAEKYTSVADCSKYFNAGVMILNLVKIRDKFDLVTEACRYFRRHPNAEWRDQDFMNYLFSNEDDVKFLEGKYNMLVSTRKAGGELESGIYHWAGISLAKIEAYGNNPFDDMFWQCMLDTPWQDEMLSYYNDICIKRVEREADETIKSLLEQLDKTDEELRSQIMQEFHVGWLDITAIGANCFIDVQNMVPKQDLLRYVSNDGHNDRKAISLVSADGTMKLLVRCDGEGEVQIDLRGLLYTDEDGKNLPYWVTYADFIVNGQNLVSSPVEACYDKPVTARKEVHDGESFVLEVHWQPSIKTFEALAT